jgi:hypothetical protein
LVQLRQTSETRVTRLSSSAIPNTTTMTAGTQRHNRFPVSYHCCSTFVTDSKKRVPTDMKFGGNSLKPALLDLNHRPHSVSFPVCPQQLPSLRADSRSLVQSTTIRHSDAKGILWVRHTKPPGECGPSGKGWGKDGRISSQKHDVDWRYRERGEDGQ